MNHEVISFFIKFDDNNLTNHISLFWGTWNCQGISEIFIEAFIEKINFLFGNSEVNLFWLSFLWKKSHISLFCLFKGVLHPWALFLKTLCIFSKNKATSDKVSYGSGQKCSKELKNHSFTSVETIVVKLQWKMCKNQYFSCFEP